MAVRGWMRDRAVPLALVLALISTALAVTAGWLAWTANAEAAAQSVRVTAAGSPDCAPGRDVNNGRRVLMVVTPDRSCVIDVDITNHGDQSVHLDGLELPGIGTRAEIGNQMVIADFAGSGDPKMENPERGPASSPATYHLDVDLTPGETYEAQLALMMNPKNCSGGARGLSPWPAVVIDANGRQQTVGPATALELRLSSSLPTAGPSCTNPG